MINVANATAADADIGASLKRVCMEADRRSLHTFEERLLDDVRFPNGSSCSRDNDVAVRRNQFADKNPALLVSAILNPEAA